MIEAYADLGGDEGVTEDCMRMACGLALRDRQKDAAAGAAAVVAIEGTSQDEVDAVRISYQIVADHVFRECLDKGKDSFTLGMFKYLTLPPNAPNVEKESLWNNMRTYGMMADVVIERRKGKDAMRPVIASKYQLRDIMEVKPDSTALVFPETYNFNRLKTYLHEHPSRFFNVETIQRYYADYMTFLTKGKKGKRSNAELRVIEELQSEIDKFSAGESLALKFLDMVTSVKKRRVEKTNSLAESSGAPLKEASVSYHSTLQEVNFRTRLQANGIGAQIATRRVLYHLVPHTCDLDIENCMFTIILQLLRRLKVTIPPDLEETLRMCAESREQVCQDDLRTDLQTGKNRLNQVVNGASISPEWDGADFLRRVQKLSRYLRWLACSLLPDVYEVMREDTSRKFPEASTLFFLWTSVEDFILSVWVKFVLQLPVRHLSLHFDGIRLDADFPGTVEDYCKQCCEHIANETGFVVNIREKKHYSFLELIPKKACESTVLDGKDEVLDRPGNCIAGAVYDLLGESERGQLLIHLKNTELPANVVAANRCVRSYAEVQRVTQVSMVPCMGFNLSLPGKYLLHTEAGGRPHCISVQAQFKDAKLHCEVIDGNNRWLMLMDDLIACAAVAVEKATIVTYRVFLPGQVAMWPDKPSKEVLSVLLELQAGASSDGCQPTSSLSQDGRTACVIADSQTPVPSSFMHGGVTYVLSSVEPLSCTFEVHVKSLGGSVLTLSVRESSTVWDLKAMIHLASSVSPHDMRLHFPATRALADTHSLTAYGVMPGSTIFVFGRDVPVEVCLEHDMVSVTVDSFDTVKALKAQVRDRVNVARSCCLVTGVTAVQDDDFLANKQVLQTCKAHLVLLPQRMRLFLRSSTSLRSVQVHISSSSTIRDLKKLFQICFGLSVSRQRLMFHKARLEHCGYTLCYYNILPESTVYISGNDVMIFVEVANCCACVVVNELDTVEVVMKKLHTEA